MSGTWGIKFNKHEIVRLRKSATEEVSVRIEGVCVRKNDPPIYNVRETETMEGYPASESSLTRIPLKKTQNV